MSSFFRSPLVKVLLAVLCIFSLMAAILCGGAVAALLATGSYDGEGNLFTPLAQSCMYRDAERIMNGYFDPAEPTEPWKSYYSGGIYTGENSNFIYNITDNDTGYSVLATVEGGEPICMKETYPFYFDTQISTTVNVETDVYVLEDQVFQVEDGQCFGYDAENDSFYPIDEMTSGFINCGTMFPVDVYDSGFSYDIVLVVESSDANTAVEYTTSAPVPYIHYAYDGYGFYPVDGWYEEVVYQWESMTYTITCYLLDGLPNDDLYRDIYELTNFLTVNQNELVPAFVCFFLLFLITIVLLSCSMGWVKGKEEPVVNLLYKVPTEVSLAAGMILWCCCLGFMLTAFRTDYFYYAVTAELLLTAGISVCTVYLITFCAVRRKTRTFLRGSLLFWCVKNARRLASKFLAGCTRALHYLPLVWKVMVCYVGLCFLEFCFLMMGSTDGECVFLWFLLKVVLGALVLYAALALRRLKKGAESIAAGDYTTQVDDKYLVMDFKETADTLNHIQGGMNVAVESRMKSERLKTELITNVSHDLKTPLTSIVSYVDLLKQEPAGSTAAEEYLEVLDRQSQRLKKLIEDLMEASKASTGNIPMTKEPLDFSMVLGQALGEYRERLDNAGLIPVLKLPEEPAMVEADGRLLWRIFDNLLGNIVKYAMPGTRVYLTVEAGTAVSATFRNISKEALDITADELMERFVRGDSSRHTEGSGLGLSIAKSLAESMGGSFALQVDGDLFKATVTFPVCAVNE